MREAWDNQGNDLNEGGMGQSGQRLLTLLEKYREMNEDEKINIL